MNVSRIQPAILAAALCLGACTAMAEEHELGTSGFADSDGVKIHYVTAGEGPLVVMLHGFPDYWYTWREQMPALAERFQVVALDMRGYNQSDKPEGVENYTMDKLTGDVAAVIKHLGRDQAVVVGHDWGGAVAWACAIQRPEIVERLVILNLPHPTGLARELANNPEQQKNSEYARIFQKSEPAPRLMLEAFAKLGGQQGGLLGAIKPESDEAAAKMAVGLLAFWVKDKDARQKYQEAFARSDLEAMLNYYKANYPREPYTYSEEMQLPKVQCPVLMIHGLGDTALLPGALNDTWKWIDNQLTLVTIPDAGHFVQQDAADTVTKRMVGWLTQSQ